jgi:type VI secretion system secreted protein Hcp
MAFDAFLQLYYNGTAVTGESIDNSFGGSIELSEFSFGAENSVSISSATGGAGAGKATFKEFSIKKLTDTASTSLFTNLCQGSHYTARISIRKSGAAAGAAGAVYLTFDFNVLMVKSIDWSGSSGDDVPTESVVFMYGEMSLTYQRQMSNGSLASPPYSTTWSAQNNATGFNATIPAWTVAKPAQS